MKPIAFVTLTYNDENLPHDLSLDPKHFQRFIRKLRKRCGKVRYYHCGEYGDETDRPHYHAILFGVDFRHDRVLYRRTSYGNLYTSRTLSRAWSRDGEEIGYAVIADCTPQTARYVAGYVTKKLWGDAANEKYAIAWKPDGETGELVPCGWKKAPYSTMSLKPGIGQGYVEKFGEELYAHDQFLEVDNKPLRPPKFFDRWLEERDPQRLEHLQHARAKRAERYWRDRSPERLRVKDRIGQYREKQNERKQV
jgi:hypothetical protein